MANTPKKTKKPRFVSLNVEAGTRAVIKRAAKREGKLIYRWLADKMREMEAQ